MMKRMLSFRPAAATHALRVDKDVTPAHDVTATLLRKARLDIDFIV
jgi:hypothetical protein